MIDREAIIKNLKNVYDPEIPAVSLYDLGLIYDIDLNNEKHKVTILHTLTSAFCPFADQIVSDIRQAGYVDEVRWVEVNTTFDPPFSMDLVPEETRLILGWY
jgi:metal-sulfur cluster biosynthetic enzyme|tara:strand:+ start:1924 stop:2229 length:306 start_codon:yes stop_codon:yes gene_type:complete